MKNITTIAFIIFTCNLAYSCCTCTKSTHRFTDNLDKYSFIGIVEVIQKDSFTNINPGFITVRVTSQFTKEFYGTEFRIPNSDGMSCYVGLFNNKIGSKSIVKGHFNNIQDYHWRYEDDDLNTKEQVLVLSLCAESQLTIEPQTNIVIGPLNHDKLGAIYKWNDFLEKITFGLIKREVHNLKPQRTSFKGALKIIKNRLRDLQYNN